MRSIYAAVLLCLVPFAVSAAPQDQAISRGSGPVPGALVCPDFRSVQAAFRSFTARRGPPPYSYGGPYPYDGPYPYRGPGPEYFGCRMVPPGTILKVDGADPGGAPIVSGVLPGGEPVRGVTLNDMIEPFAFKPAKPGLAKPAAPSPTKSAKQDAAPGKLPLPTLQNSPDTLCGVDHQCTDDEFTDRRSKFEKRWALMPDSLQKKCQTNSTLPAMEKCTSEQTTSWVNAHPDKETPWMDPELIN